MKYYFLFCVPNDFTLLGKGVLKNVVGFMSPFGYILTQVYSQHIFVRVSGLLNSVLLYNLWGNFK